MTFISPGAGALDYWPCRYGKSKLMFRGPQRDVGGPFVAVLGGNEAFGKFVSRPFPDLLEPRLGLPIVNFGLPNAGLDVFLQDADVMRMAGAAQAVVVQVLGAQNLTNRYYAVHPRRNDRFVGESRALRDLYPDVDFTEFHFTSHMMGALHRRSADRFGAVADDLRGIWLDRMTALLDRVGARTILLWAAAQPPRAAATVTTGHYPALIDEAMVARIRPLAAAYVEVSLKPDWPSAGDLHPLPDPAVAVPGAAAHRQMADAIAPVLRRFL